MALSKEITATDGVVTRYHRIVTLTTYTNVADLIEVCSYIDEAKRDEERAALAANEPMDVYMRTSRYVAPYDEGMTISSAYEWLKKQKEFEGAADVPEDGSADQRGE